MPRLDEAEWDEAQAVPTATQKARDALAKAPREHRSLLLFFAITVVVGVSVLIVSQDVVLTIWALDAFLLGALAIMFSLITGKGR